MTERNYKIVKQDRKGLDAVKKPTAIDVAWAAGIYEGEGSCTTNHSGSGSMSFAVTVAQKDPELLYRLRDKANEHRQKYLDEYQAKQSADPEYRERKRLEQQERRRLRKVQKNTNTVEEKTQQTAQVFSIQKTA